MDLPHERVLSRPQLRGGELEGLSHVEHLLLSVFDAGRYPWGSAVLWDYHRPDPVWQVRVSRPVEARFPHFFLDLRQLSSAEPPLDPHGHPNREPKDLIEVFPRDCPHIRVESFAKASDDSEPQADLHSVADRVRLLVGHQLNAGSPGLRPGVFAPAVLERHPKRGRPLSWIKGCAVPLQRRSRPSQK